MVRVAGLKRRIATGLAVAVGLRPGAARGARGDLDRRARADGPARPGLQRRGPAGPGRGGHHARALGRADRRPSRSGWAALPRPGLPGAHPAGRRPGPPVPLHLRALAQPGRRRASTPKTGTEHFARVKVPPLLPRFVAIEAGRDRRRPEQCRPVQARFVPLEDVIAAHLDQLFPGMEVLRAPHLPGHPQRGPRGRGGRRREPAAGAGEGADPAPVRPAGAARGRRGHRRRTSSTCWSASSGSTSPRSTRCPRRWT